MRVVIRQHVDDDRMTGGRPRRVVVRGIDARRRHGRRIEADDGECRRRAGCVRVARADSKGVRCACRANHILQDAILRRRHREALPLGFMRTAELEITAARGVVDGVGHYRVAIRVDAGPEIHCRQNCRGRLRQRRTYDDGSSVWWRHRQRRLRDYGAETVEGLDKVNVRPNLGNAVRGELLKSLDLSARLIHLLDRDGTACVADYKSSFVRRQCKVNLPGVENLDGILTALLDDDVISVSCVEYVRVIPAAPEQTVVSALTD